MKRTIEVALRRSGMRGQASVERTEKFLAEVSVEDGVMCLGWRASNGQQTDLACPLREMREVVAEAPRSQSEDGSE